MEKPILESDVQSVEIVEIEELEQRNTPDDAEMIVP
jgi:hypothetical protein